MNITSKKDSTVSILAIDKRVTFLATGNDFDRDSIAKPYNDYESDLHYVNNDLKVWRKCTDEELKLIQDLNKAESTKVFSFQDLMFHFSGGDVFKKDVSIKNSNNPEGESTNAQRDIHADNVREYFPETWIFETIDMKEGDIFKFQKKVPDSITSWIITAFSMHPEYGFALTKPIELIVSQEFFMKLSVPNFIKVGEVVEVNVIVFNYLESQNSMTGSVTLDVKEDDNYRIVDKTSGGSSCTVSLSPSLTKTLKFSANHRQSMMLTFNVQAINSGTLTLRFTAVSGIHRDEVHRKITVEPAGLRKSIYSKLSLSHRINASVNELYVQSCINTDVNIYAGPISKRSLMNYNAER